MTADTLACPACDVEHDRMIFHSLGMVCARCNQHTGNNHQGHYWGLCKVWLAEGKPWKDSIRELHFCCPGDCALDDSPGSKDAS